MTKHVPGSAPAHMEAKHKKIVGSCPPTHRGLHLNRFCNGAQRGLVIEGHENRYEFQHLPRSCKAVARGTKRAAQRALPPAPHQPLEQHAAARGGAGEGGLVSTCR